MNPEPILSPQLREAMDKWNKQQDEANTVLSGSTLKVPKELKPKQGSFCSPTFVAMSAKALEDKEK